jgi:RES domain-containing protein
VIAAWRISIHADLNGLGGERGDGRWHTAAQGKRIVYLSEHPAVALLETLVNLKGDPRFFPSTYQLLKIRISEGVRVAAVRPEQLSAGWRETIAETRSIGDAWLASGESALLAVPSAPSPESTNYVLNPRHPETSGIAMEWAKRLRYDRRLFRVIDTPAVRQ